MKSIAQLLQHTCKALSVIPSEAILPFVEYSGDEALLKSMTLSDMEEIGLELVVRYGNMQRYHLAKLRVVFEFCFKVKQSRGVLLY